jgi:hypothetical protein
MQIHDGSLAPISNAGARGTSEGVVAGRYRLRERIGKGRLGEIYSADDGAYRGLGVRKPVALQLVHDSLMRNETTASRLRWGFGMLRDDRHPDIVRVREFGQDGSFGYLVMEELEGASLRQLLELEHHFPIEDTCAVIAAVASGLQYLHGKSMVHGKVTPENVFLTFDQEVRLLDIVPLTPPAANSSNATRSAATAPLDVRDDVYGLAALTYEMLAGRHPYHDYSPAEAQNLGLKLAEIETLPVRKWRAIEKGLAPDREQRFATVSGFLQEFGIAGWERLSAPALDGDRDYQGQAAWQPDDRRELPVVESAMMTVGVAASQTSVSDAGRSAEKRAAPARRETRAATRRHLPSPLLAVILLAVGGWYWLGQPGDDLASASMYIDPVIDDVSARLNRAEISAMPARDPIGPADEFRSAPVAESQPAAASDEGPAETGESTGDATPAGEEAGDGPPEILSAEILPDMTEAAPAAPVDSADPDAGQPAPVPSAFGFDQPVVIVAERSAFARVTMNLGEAGDGRYFWWTSEEGARGDADFIGTERPVPGFVSGEPTETLHVPLVDDSIPEAQEAFYVHLGRYDDAIGRFETLSSIRVEITDDD